jgi:SH3 domain protein
MTRYLLTGLLFMLPALAVLAQQTDSEAVIEAVPEKPREMLYVTDQLRLSLYPQASDRSKALEYLASGDKLGILEIEGQYALVIAPTGTRGWVKRGFLLPQPTSKLLLGVEKEKNKTLLQEIEKLANSKVVIDQYERDMDELTKNLKTAEAEKENAVQKVAEMEQAAREKAELEDAIKAAKQSKTTLPLQALIDTAKSYWQYFIPILLFFVLLGFLIAKLIIDQRIKKRFHGLKLW